ncbi:MAG: HlyC/CorC family transporter [Gammaproteobacteria bacterium]|nr:HlyC/CorC family transporter [Gammaproteobacteria bacterium]
MTVAGLGVLIIISGFFSSAETGMMATNRYRLQHEAQAGNKKSRQVLSLLQRPDRLLGVILIGNTFANILASTLATIIAIDLYGETSAFIASVILTFLVLIFSEVAPKTVAALYPEKTAALVSFPLRCLLRISYPIVWIINTIANALLRLIGIRVKGTQLASLSTEELRTIVHTSAEDIPSQDRSMLLGVFDLKQITVEEIMVPRGGIIGIDLNDNLHSIVKQLHQIQHTRIPVFQGNIDHTCGLLHVRDILPQINQTNFNKKQIKKYLRQIHFVPENADLKQQLLRFQKIKNRMALVVDEYGKVKGLVTLDNILEEIVGAFTTDILDNTQDIIRQKDGSYVIDGSATLRDINKELHTSFTAGDVKTLNGLVIEHLGSIPKAGLLFELDGHKIEILQVKHNRVKLIRLTIQT